MTDGRKMRPVSPVSDLIVTTLDGQVDRRAVMRRAMALGLAAPLVAAMLKNGPSAAAQEASPVAAPTGDPILIGSPYNLTGGYASIDNPASQGSLLAVKEINEAGGVLGRPLEIIIEDGRSDVPTISSVAQKLVEEDGVHVMAGLTDTSYMLAAGPVAQEAGIPFLDVGGTAPLITTVGDYIFMLPFGDNVQAAVAAEYANEQGWTTAAILVDQAMDYTKFLAQYFVERFTMEDIGGEIVSELSYSMGDTDFSGQLTQFVNLDPQPDFLFISANPGEIGTIVRQARDLGLDLPIVGGDGYDTPLLAELGGDAATNIIFTTHQGIYDQTPVSEAFNEAYEAEYGNPPEAVFAALGYDGIYLMVDAIERAGTIDGAAVRDALAATQGFEGVTGTISYEAGSRIPSKSVALIEVVDGQNNLIEITVPEVVPEA